MDDLRKYRKYFFKNLCIPCYIGVHNFEKENKQNLIFDIELYIPLNKSTSHNDNIKDVIDYDFVRETIYNYINSYSHIDLLETLCDGLLNKLLSHDGIYAVSISITKPSVYPDCQVGIQCFKYLNN